MKMRWLASALLVSVVGLTTLAFAGPKQPLPSEQPTPSPVSESGVTVLAADAKWPGKIFVNHDEWTLSDEVYTEDSAQLARNVAAWFTKGRPGRFLVYSSNFGLTGKRLERTMREAGHTWTVTKILDFSLSTLQQYDAILLAGDPADNLVLIDYVRAGGNVYLAGGTGWGGPVEEAKRWNTFLNAFGLSLAPVYNHVALGQYLPIDSAAPVLRDVRHLYQYFGNSVSVLDPSNGDTEVLLSEQEEGLYAAYGGPAIAVPVDIKPENCGNNTVDIRTRSRVQAAVLGTADFNARTIDPSSVRLLGVAPIHAFVLDIATPAQPFIGRTAPSGCKLRPDKRADLVLTFDSQALVEAMTSALGRAPRDGEVIALSLTGSVKSHLGGMAIVGEDLVVIKASGKR